MSRIFIWLESSSCLNFVSERDPDEIVQTHMLSRAFGDHICHKFQQGLYQVIWGSAQVDFMVRVVFKKRAHAYTDRIALRVARGFGHIAELGKGGGG